MNAPTVKEVLALSRKIDEAKKRRLAATEEEAQHTAQLEQLIGIGTSAAPKPDFATDSPAEALAYAESLAPGILGPTKTRARKMPPIRSDDVPPPSDEDFRP